MRPHSWKLVAALLIGAGLASTATAQPMTRGGRPVGAPSPGELFNYWFGDSSELKNKSAKKDGKDSKDNKAKPTTEKKSAAKPTVAEKPETEEKPVAEKATERFEREQRAFMRRLAVCDRLRQVALQTNDESLFRKADQLQEEAWSHCLERTGMVPVDGDASATDKDILDQHLGSDSRSTRVDRLYSVPSRDETPRAVAQEDQP